MDDRDRAMALTGSAEDGLVVGIDLVHAPLVAAALQDLGERYVSRVFTESECAYAMQVPDLAPARLAARFAAKEAAIKAFGWAEVGVDFRDIEVWRRDDGACELRFHGKASALLSAGGFGSIALSMSHDGDYATAIVVARRRSSPTQT